MQDIEQLPTAMWAEQLQSARLEAGLEVGALARELMLSPLQVRGMESGSLSAFHGPGYYLRAVEKYAHRLGIELDPQVTELKLTDSQLALKRVKNRPSAEPLASRHSNFSRADTMPGRAQRGRIGLWVAGIVLLLLGAGFWLAVKEGWPGHTADGALPLQAQADITQTTEPAPPALADARAQGTDQAPASVTQQSLPLGTVSSPLETNPLLPPGSEALVAIGATPAFESAPEPEPVAEPAAEPAPEPAPEPEPLIDEIEIRFSADCWVEIRRLDGTVAQGIYQPGQTLVVPVTEVERLSFGNAQAVVATRAGEPFDVMRFTRAGNNVARISAADLEP